MINERVNIQQAWSGEHSVHWKEATDSEYDSLMNNHTGDLVPHQEGNNVVGSRLVFKVKRSADAWF